MKEDIIEKLIQKTIGLYCDNFLINPDDARSKYKNMINHYTGKCDDSWALNLRNNWYESLKTKADYSGYNDDWYFTDMLACFKIYSSKYIKLISKLGLNPKSIIDLGCGLGITSQMLKEYFKCDVIGTNLKDTKQWRFCKTHMNVVETYEEKADTIFASEYFEHIQDATDHLTNIINKNAPNTLIMANSFTAKSFGHFNTYINKNNNNFPKLIDCKNMTRHFSMLLKENGYKKHDQKFWNNRPQVWIKI